MSVLKTVLRGTIRLLVRPGLAPGMPVSVARPMATLLAQSTPMARGIELSHTELAGLATERLVPREGQRASVAVLYLHGGAFRIGSARMYRGLVARLAQHTRAEVLAPDYRLAPEHAFPAAHDDAFEAARVLLLQRPNARLVLAGDSAGGALALQAAQRLVMAGETRLAGVLLISPWLDLSVGGESARTKNAIDPMLSREGLAFAAADYLRGHADTSAEASPLFGEFRGLPQIHVEVGSDEVLLDDSVRLAELARAADVQANVEVVDGMWHDFPLHAGLLREADEAMARMGGFVARVTGS